MASNKLVSIWFLTEEQQQFSFQPSPKLRLGMAIMDGIKLLAHHHIPFFWDSYKGY
jgi:hypothetical protein